MTGRRTTPLTAATGLALLALLTSGCASTGGGGAIAQDRSTCMLVGGVLGGVIGAVVANNSGESETDEEVAGGGLGAATGALLGYLLCGEGAPAPQAPSVRVSARPTSGSAPLEVAFDAIARDANGSIVGYAWDFGDGNTARGARVAHTYGQPGRYDVTLTVTDSDGQTATGSARIDVTAAAEAEPVEPAEEPATRRRIVLRGINFGFDSAQIAETDGLILDVAVEQLASNPGVRVRVVGHTDSSGAESYNQSLSERRARAVVDYLASKGIERARLSVEGQGESSPVASNDTRDGRAQNRRVSLEIVD